MEVFKKYAPSIPINVSTQANIVSLHDCNFWYKNGGKRMIMARELNKNQLKYIMENKPKDMEVEIFIHGAICFAFSGRCFLSDFLACRSANLGDCAQSCRWSYNLYAEEKNNPGEFMPIETNEYGTSIFSSKDLCLIKEIPEIVDMGVDSLKIEGRLKTEYYLASVINAYRNAIDDYIKNPKNYEAFDPREVGLERQIVIGKHSGKAAIINKFMEYNINLTEDEANMMLEAVRALSIRAKRILFDKELVQLYNDIKKYRHIG